MLPAGHSKQLHRESNKLATACPKPLSRPQERDPLSPTAGGPVNYAIRRLWADLRPLVGLTHQMELSTTGGRCGQWWLAGSSRAGQG